VLQTFANHAAVAIANTLLYEAAQRQRAELEAKNRELEKAAQWLHAARQNEIVNAERTRIGRDLHDSVAQHLLSIGMNLEWCRAQLAEHDDPAIYERITTTKELARSAVGRIRETIFELSAIKGREFDLVAALRELAAEMQQTTGLPVVFREQGAPRRLDGMAEDALYHIAQEALFNAYKHAGAAAVTLTLRFKPEATLLSIVDDGVGIAAQARRRSTPSAGGGFGLRNMRARAHEVGAECTVRRRLRGGTEVRVRLGVRGAG
jgi:signal transduction histidine kinase